MDIFEQRYYILTAVSEEGTFHVYSTDETIKPGDLIVVDGLEKPLEVIVGDYLSLSELDIPLESMHTVKALAVEESPTISQKALNTLSKVTEEETKLQAEEEKAEEKAEEEAALEEKAEETPEEAMEETIEPNRLSFSLRLDGTFSLISYETDLAIHVYDRGERRTTQTEYGFFQEFKINNPTDHTLRGLKVVFRFSTPILSCADMLLPSLEYREEISLRAPFIKVDRKEFMKLDAPLASSLTVELYSPKGKLLAQHSENFFVLPIGEMNHFFEYDPRLWCKFITPSAKEVKELTLNAAPSSPFGSFLGYQHADLNDKAKEIASLYEAIAKKAIAYQNPPAGTTPFQKVRLPSQVLQDHKGTCLDLSILFCAALEEIGYHPILIILDKHAMAGVFLKPEDRFENARSDKLLSFLNRITKDVFLVDCVDLTNPAISCQTARDDALEQLRNYNGREFLAVDVVEAHKSIFSPLPLQGEESELDPEALYRKAVEEELDPILEHNYKEIHHEVSKDRFTFWENKLLDLTEKNPLVSFHFSPTNFVKLVKPRLAEHLLSEKPLPLRFVETAGSSSRTEQISDILGSDAAAIPPGGDSNHGYLFGKMRSFRSILSKNQSEIEETGAATLYLCMGLLTYQAADRSKKNKKAYAPFMLLPIKIERGSGIGSSSYTMVYDYDDAMVNKTFFEFYKIDHPEFDVSPLYNPNRSEHDSFHDLCMTFIDKVSDNISLDENTFFIANLTFAHYIMWTDMTLRKEELKKNKVVSSIVNRESMLEKTSLADVESIEREEHYRDFAAPLPYDSTQLSAILEAGEGKSFILDGPPGTGKSQTIVNIIVNAIYHGKTVLFVAEKKAALDVVADRLKKIKLDRFCLELHSTKANKRDFFSKLGESIRLGPTEGTGNFVSTVNSLEDRRISIKEKIAAMHEAKAYCLSFFEAITLELNLGNKAKPFSYPKELIKKARRRDYDKSIEFLNEYVRLAKSYGGIENSELRRVGLEFFSVNDEEDAKNDFLTLLEDIEDFIRKATVLFDGSKLNLQWTNENIKLLFDAFACALDEDIYVDKMEAYLLLDDGHTFDPLFNKTQVLLNLKNGLEGDFDLAKLREVDVDALIAKLNSAGSFLSRHSANSIVKKSLQNALISSKKPAKTEYLDLLATIQNYQKLYKEVQSESFGVNPYLPFSLIEHIDELSKIRDDFQKSFAFASLLRRIELLPGGENAAPYFIDIALTKSLGSKRHYDIASKAMASLQEKEKAFFEKYALKRPDFETRKDALPLDLLLNMLEEAKKDKAMLKLVDVAHLNDFAKTKASVLTMPIILAFRRGEVALNELIPSFEEVYAKEIIRLNFASNRIINDFHSNVFDEELAEYRELIKQYSNLIIEEVTARATRNLVMGRYEYKDSSPVGRLKTIVSNGGRGITIRHVLEKYDSLVRGYFPCFLMSPLSAAQYLSVENGTSPFDIVIFDEASQIPVHEAIGPIARGKSLIVAGDPKQMPPTTYFTSELNLSGDDLDYQDASSLLDECLAIDFPRIRLSYHYRSRYESLINFSNKNFYEDELHTFPAPVRGNKAVHFEQVKLSEAKTDSKMSSEEILAILTKLNLIYSQEGNKNKSVGIIVFNIKQKESLEKALEAYLEKEKGLASSIKAAEEATGEPLFVKSIENVQGDERDIIILCIGFRKTVSGRAFIVGPLARIGGERRLNVAISRSKETMYVISTITDDDFDSNAYIDIKGVLLLKQFIAYARGSEEMRAKKEEDIIQTQRRLTVSDFLRKDLEQLGYLCDSDVGESKNKVDIAIRGEKLNTYALGILLDSDEEVNGATLRDKEYVEPTIFNHLNWKIIKVYAVSYFKNKEAVIAKILSAMDKPFIRMEEKIEPTLAMKEIDTSYNCKEYEKVDLETLDQITYSSNQGFSRAVLPAISRIIFVEGPVSESVIKSRIKEKCSLMVLSRMANLLLEKELRNYEFLKDPHGFYWQLDSNREIKEFRYGGDRDIVEIPYEEFECAFLQILERQGKLSENDLFKAALEAFCLKNTALNKKNKEYLSLMYADFLEKHPEGK